MKSIINILKLVTFICISFYGLSYTYEGKSLFFPYSFTTFSNQYTRQEFGNIKVGDEHFDVEAKLGKPFNIQNLDNEITRCTFSEDNGGAWLVLNVDFKYGKVVNKQSHWAYD